MATLTNYKGRRLIQFMDHRDKRQTLSLGAMRERDAREIKSHVEELNGAAIRGMAVAADTSRWLGKIGDSIYRKLVRVGLVESRDPRKVAELGPYFDDYIARRTDLKPRSIANLKQTRRVLAEFFLDRRNMATITKGAADDFRRDALRTHAPATVSMYIKRARQVFADAVDHKAIDANPFKAVAAGDQSNESRMVYVSREDVQKVIDHCTDPEWKLVFALARFQGLRVPSETRRLRWSDIDWTQKRMTVRPTKTERYKGKGRRVVPIFPEVFNPLLERFNDEEADSELVFSRLRGDNLSTTGAKLIARAGVVAWGKTFQNLRSSCQTDLVETFPIQVACAWIGNSEAIAKKHYLQVTDQHFDQASGRAVKSAADRSGQVRTSTGHSKEKAPIAGAFSESDYPLGGSKSRRHLRRKLIRQARALHPALQSLRKHAEREDRRGLARLSVAVTRAQEAPHAS